MAYLGSCEASVIELFSKNSFQLKAVNYFSKKVHDIIPVSIGVVLVSLLLTLNIFTPCSIVSIVNFEQVNAGWDYPDSNLYKIFLGKSKFSKQVLRFSNNAEWL